MRGRAKRTPRRRAVGHDRGGMRRTPSADRWTALGQGQQPGAFERGSGYQATPRQASARCAALGPGVRRLASG